MVITFFEKVQLSEGVNLLIRGQLRTQGALSCGTAEHDYRLQYDKASGELRSSKCHSKNFS